MLQNEHFGVVSDQVLPDCDQYVGAHVYRWEMVLAQYAHCEKERLTLS